ncbi:MAG: AI-2E family transporter [Deltaproteobacteria bacterium]|nr:AI-2E family transporter [Deltaproteobacteria bacterium]MBW2153238.1 AI-2E family transporter [Deltaproteobacteria bacterium]
MILWFFLILFIISFILLGWLIWPFVSIIILASVVTGVFSPLYHLFKKKMKPALASFLTCVVIFLILFVPIVLFVGILSKEAYDLYLMGKSAVISDQVKALFEGSAIIERVNVLLSNFNLQLTAEQFNRVISEIGKFIGLFLYKQASSIASNVFAFLINFFFMLIVIYFLLLDGHKLIAFITDLSPLPREQDEKLIRKFEDIAYAILIVNGVGGLIQGILGGIVFALFGLKSPFLWGVIMGLLAFLPIFGIGAVFIPAGFLLILKGRMAAGVFFFIFYLVLSGSVEYFLKPRLVGQKAKMHTLLVFLSIMGGLKLFGILGIIYGPLVVTAFLTLNDIYHSSYQKHVETTNHY